MPGSVWGGTSRLCQDSHVSLQLMRGSERWLIKPQLKHLDWSMCVCCWTSDIHSYTGARDTHGFRWTLMKWKPALLICLHTSGKQQQGEGAILPPDDSAVGFSTDCFCFYLLSFQPGYLQDHDRYVGRILYVKMERVGARHLLLFQLFSRCSQLMRVDFEPASPAAPLSAFTP